jgi:hypothetical protein
MHTKFWLENLKERDHSKDPGINGSSWGTNSEGLCSKTLVMHVVCSGWKCTGQKECSRVCTEVNRHPTSPRTCVMWHKNKIIFL